VGGEGGVSEQDGACEKERETKKVLAYAAVPLHAADSLRLLDKDFEYCLYHPALLSAF
jgi:hypothetical protein